MLYDEQIYGQPRFSGIVLTCRPDVVVLSASGGNQHNEFGWDVSTESGIFPVHGWLKFQAHAHVG